MTATIPRGGTAVMQRRRPTPPHELDYYPTPPWATRALFPFLREISTPPLDRLSARDPGCGEGHMAAVLQEAFRSVLASDVFDYGYGEVADYLDAGTAFPQVAWTIGNPPFKSAQAFIERALLTSRFGVAMLVRTAFLEGSDRYHELFSKRPPLAVLQFAERVPMVKGEWKPDASTATAYAWIVWSLKPTGDCATAHGETLFRWIAPGQRKALTKFDDARRFARLAPAPLLGEG